MWGLGEGGGGESRDEMHGEGHSGMWGLEGGAGCRGEGMVRGMQP